MPIKTSLKITDQFLAWLFDVGTRVLEAMNFVFLIGFSVKMLLKYNEIIAYPSYKDFSDLSYETWLLMFGLGIAQLVAMLKTTIKSNKVSELVLIFSSGIWLMIAITFYSSNSSATATVTYGAFATFIALAGVYMMRVNKIASRLKDGQGGQCGEPTQ